MSSLKKERKVQEKPFNSVLSQVISTAGEAQQDPEMSQTLLFF